MSTQNSLTTLLKDLLRLEQNSVEILNSLSDVVASKKDTVTLDILDDNGQVKKVKVPSFGNLKSEIKRIDNNIKSISSLGDTQSVLQLSDGSFRKLILSSLKKEADDIKNISAPSRFNSKNNWFFESFLNPLMQVEFDFSEQIKPETERVKIDRFILDLNTPEKRKLFNEKWKDSSSIDYDNFINELTKNNIEFFRDNEVIDVPPQEPKFYGDFSVLEVIHEEDEVVQNEETFKQRVLKAKLNKLTYSDTESDFEDTVELKVGDSLIVNKGNQDTRYEINNIDTGKNILTLKRVEGFDGFSAGANILSIYSGDNVPTNVSVNIGFNEKTVLFIKPIDPDSKQPATNWSPGVGFYTNELTIEDDQTGEDINLSTFYKNRVVDFGQIVFEKAKENIPSSTAGKEPNIPQPNPEDFEVVQVNEHLTESKTFKDIKDLNSDKIKTSNEIDELTKSIKEKRKKIQTTKFDSQVQKESEENELRELINERENKSKLFSSIVNDLNSKISSESLENIKPKYRVRGFWAIPDPRESDLTKPQEIIKFRVRYRFINKNGGGNDPKQVEFQDTDGTTRRGSISPWEIKETGVKERIKDDETGNFEWREEDVENSDKPNINQLDLPISEGEAVEFQVKSISEAGYPQNPLESDWSNVVRIDFPDDLSSQFEVTEIAEEAKKEETRLKLQSEFNELGLPEHLSGSFTTNGNTYHHTTKDIASGFLTDEQNPISLFDKLRSMEDEIRELRSKIEDAKGKIKIKIVDEEGNETPVEENSVVNKFAGNYKDIVKDLDIKKGVIVTRTYFVKIENEAASDLEMYSRIPGSVEKMVKDSYTGGSSFDPNDLKYNEQLRYDIVPLGLTNPDSNEISHSFNFRLPQQSGQSKSQFIYSRYQNVDGTTNLYGDVNKQNGDLLDPNGNPISGPDDIEYRFKSLTTTNWPSSNNPSQDFIWDGLSNSGLVDTSSVDFSADQIEIHEDHPLIPDFVQGNKTPKDIIRNSKYAPEQETDTQNFSGLKQNPFFINSAGESIQLGFKENDQYLLGPRSVGSYLFLAPQSHDDIDVNGADSLAVKKISFGPSNSLTIPIIFQFRMTDYWGKGDSGIGNIGGDPSGSTDQLVYTKKIGLDIYHTDSEKFSFDLKITAKYKSTSLSSADVPQRTFSNAIDDQASQGSGNINVNIS